MPTINQQHSQATAPATANIRPADTHVFSLPLAEKIAVSWIERVSPAPVHLAHIVRQYRDLEFFVDTPAVATRMNLLYDQLVAAATAKGRVSVDVQIRRIEQRPNRLMKRLLDHADQMPYSERCNRAIELWQQGVRV